MSDFDYLVIGSGAAGAAAAWKFCKNGFKVGCVDRGGWMDPTKYPSTTPDWEQLKRTIMNPVTGERQNGWDYPVDDTNSPISVCNFNAIGGSTILYSGHFPRFLPTDFQLKSVENLGSDWPIKYDELRPYFAENEKQMAVSGLVGDPMYPDIENLLPPVPLGLAGETLAKAFNAKGWHWWPSYSAIATRATAGRNACINLGPCNTGCPQGAKSSTDITYIPKAIKMGLKLLPEITVSTIIVQNGRAVGVNAYDSLGNIKKIFAKNIVLAASAIGSAQILLNSKSTDAPNGLGNNSGELGRNLMIHPLGYVEGLFSERLDTDIGPQGCMLYSLQHYRTNDTGHKLGYMMHALRGTGPVEAALSAYDKRKLELGDRLYSSFSDFYRKQLVISIICEDLPQTYNKIELDKNNADKFGIPGIKLSYKISDNTKKMMAHGMGRAKEVLIEAGAKKTYAFGPVRNTGWHLLGTARMGSDPKNSIVAPDGSVHGVESLYVVDSSVFVTGSCVNPANTIQAVALYLADRISCDSKSMRKD